MDSVNIYNILEECHYEPAALKASSGPSIMAERKRKMAMLIRHHNKWPLRPVLGGHNERVHNWATLLGDNPPCVVSPYVLLCL